MTDALAEQPLKLSNVERAAVLVMSLGHDVAVQVLRHLGPRDIHRLSRAMTSLRQVRREELRAALDHFFADAADATGLGVDSDTEVQRLLVDSLGEERAEVLFERVAMHGDTRGLETLKWLDARAIADFIGREHPQIQAVVVAYLEPAHAAEVMALLSPEQRLDIAMRLAALDAVQPAALEELNALVEQRFAASAALPGQSVAGRKAVASVLRHLQGAELDHLLSALHREDQELGSTIEELMFVFEDLGSLETIDLRKLLGEVAADRLAVALKGAGPELRQRLLAILPRRQAERIRETLSASGREQMADVESAQREILMIARRMAAAGEILIDSGRRASGRQAG